MSPVRNILSGKQLVGKEGFFFCLPRLSDHLHFHLTSPSLSPPLPVKCVSAISSHKATPVLYRQNVCTAYIFCVFFFASSSLSPIFLQLFPYLLVNRFFMQQTLILFPPEENVCLYFKVLITSLYMLYLCFWFCDCSFFCQLGLSHSLLTRGAFSSVREEQVSIK